MLESVSTIIPINSQQVNNFGVSTFNTEKEDDRQFNYKLDEKTVKAKLLKGAKRIPFEIELKTNCAIFYFSTPSIPFMAKK